MLNYRLGLMCDWVCYTQLGRAALVSFTNTAKNMWSHSHPHTRTPWRGTHANDKDIWLTNESSERWRETLSSHCTCPQCSESSTSRRAIETTVLFSASQPCSPHSYSCMCVCFIVCSISNLFWDMSLPWPSLSPDTNFIRNMKRHVLNTCLRT